VSMFPWKKFPPSSTVIQVPFTRRRLLRITPDRGDMVFFPAGPLPPLLQITSLDDVSVSGLPVVLDTPFFFPVHIPLPMAEKFSRGFLLNLVFSQEVPWLRLCEIFLSVVN